MLVHLGVRDLAIVDNLELDLGPGMTVLTGETGAGKSLIVDALELAVGERASADLVRDGAESAEVNAVFDAAGPVQRWLRDQSLHDPDGACMLRRVVSADGRSRAFINGRPVPVAQLRELGELLVDVHGQHAHQGLLNAQAQRELLDAFCENGEHLARLAALHAAMRELDREITAPGDEDQDPRARLDYLDFQIDELRAQPVDPDQLEAVNREHLRLANASELIAAVARANDALEDESSGAQHALASAMRSLEPAVRLDPALDAPRELLAQCSMLLDEAASELRRYGESPDIDEGRLETLERTLAALHDLARKHRCTAGELHARLAALVTERDSLDARSGRLTRARAERDRLLHQYRVAAGALSERRIEGAQRLGAQADAVLRTLGMQDARIRFAIRHDPQGSPGVSGTDSVSLQASTNPGQEPLPLVRVASGGELSRIALAVHAVATRDHAATTVVFDEVDAGVGGAVAEIVGRRMRTLGDRRQVLTVTHLPQVAALAHHHVAVRKKHEAGAGSRTRATVLDDDARAEEIARMLGGVDITSTTLAHAREMLAAGTRSAGARRGGPRRRAE